MPSPELIEEEEEEEQTDDQPADDEDTMPETEDPEEDIEEELNEDEEPEEEEVSEEEEDEDVAEATLPEDDDETPSEGDGESGGILSKIPTRLIIVGSAIAIAGVLVMWFLRGGSGSPQERAREAEEASREYQTNEEGGMDYSAPPEEPLERDREMMSALGMGDGMGQ